jgi:branched-chain amino acid aminotransferase
MTPPLEDHILASITRALVMEASGAQERPCTLDDLFAADEAFLASTTREVQPVSAVNDHRFGEGRGVTAGIAAEVGALIRSRLS